MNANAHGDNDSVASAASTKYIDKTFRPLPISGYSLVTFSSACNNIEYVGISAIYDGPPNGFIYPDLMMKCRAHHASFLRSFTTC